MFLTELVEAAIIDPSSENSVDEENRGDMEDTLNIISGLVTTESGEPSWCSSTVSLHTRNPDTEDESSMSRSGSSENLTSLTDDSRDFGVIRTPPRRQHTIVKLSHFSVKEYLESNHIVSSTAGNFHLDSAKAHGFITHSCLEYLKYYSATCDIPERVPLYKNSRQYPLMKYAANSWYNHSKLQQSDDVDREISFLQTEATRRSWRSVYEGNVRGFAATTLDMSDGNPMRSIIETLDPISSSLFYASFLWLTTVVDRLLGSWSALNNPTRTIGLQVAFLVASRAGYKDVVQLLVDNGADVDDTGGSKVSALYAASSNGHQDVAQLLLIRGANIDHISDVHPVYTSSFRASALRTASSAGNIEMVRLLLDRGADVNASDAGEYGFPLHAAAIEGNTNVVQLLIDNGSEVNAVDDNRADRYVRAAGEVVSALALASAAFGGTHAAQLLLERGADFNTNGGRCVSVPLHVAAAHDQREMAQLLLDYGSDVDGGGGRCGTALIAASIGQAPGTLQLLLDHGASINHTAEVATFALGSHRCVDTVFRRMSALQAASYVGHADIVQLLLDGGADVNMTAGLAAPLHLAINRCHSDAVTILRAAGALETTPDVRVED